MRWQIVQKTTERCDNAQEHRFSKRTTWTVVDDAELVAPNLVVVALTANARQ